MDDARVMNEREDCMVYSNGLHQQAEVAILGILAPSAVYAPKDLIHHVKEHSKIDDATIREALWRLIDRMEIKLTPDRKLERRPVSA